MIRFVLPAALALAFAPSAAVAQVAGPMPATDARAMLPGMSAARPPEGQLWVKPIAEKRVPDSFSRAST